MKDQPTNELQKAIDVLMEAYTEAGGKVFARRLMQVKGNDEVKKQLEAADFMSQLFEGNLKLDKDENDLGPDYQDMLALARAINVLTAVGKELAKKKAAPDLAKR